MGQVLRCRRCVMVRILWLVCSEYAFGIWETADGERGSRYAGTAGAHVREVHWVAGEEGGRWLTKDGLCESILLGDSFVSHIFSPHAQVRKNQHNASMS